MVENEIEYRNRAKELIKTQTLYQEFDNVIVKYTIKNDYFYFLTSESQGKSFQLDFMGFLTGTTEEMIDTLISNFAHADQKLFASYGFRATNP
jgi:hypothetical protein